MLVKGATGGRPNMKMSSYQYRDPHAKDKTVSLLSLTWESPYMGKTVFILRQVPSADKWQYICKHMADM